MAILFAVDYLPARCKDAAMLSIPANPSSKLMHEHGECARCAAFVRGARSALGINQTLLAELLGVTRSTLVRLEKGTPPLRQALCEAAIEVLGQLGAKHNTGQDEFLSIAIDFNALDRVQRIMAEVTNEQECVFALMGMNFVAPLTVKPLRKK